MGAVAALGAALVLFCPGVALAAPGDLDPTFGTGGKVTTNFGGTDNEARGVAVQADGKIIAVGQSDSGGTIDFALARYNPDGSLDSTFGTGGKVTTDFGGGGDLAFGVVVQADGKIIAAGLDFSGSTFFDFALARYNTDGSLDTTFGTGGKVTTDFGGSFDVAFGVVVQADGKIVAVGSAGGIAFALARYNTDGSLDSTFGTGGKVTTNFGGGNEARAVALQADGKIIAAGVSTSGTADFALARYNTDGSLDSTFGTGGKVTTNFGGTDEARAVALQADGKIIAAGLDFSGGAFEFALARYQDGGSIPQQPSLTIDKTHNGKFAQGGKGTYTITVGNEGPGATDGSTVTVHDTLPEGLTAADLSGSGWNCTLATLTCTRSDALAAGSNYPPITLKADVSCKALSRGTNTATVTGGGDSATHTATDPTTIQPKKRCQNHHHKPHHKPHQR
ncbi:hypothetical protein ACFWDI_26440 [Streptomyces sp. NPDC060064]|uniref:hypothetical protein n=1 Tax=Streptomyces sp. NPDC060064 TaxID=3347049 RepID=UPI0036BF638B